MQHTFSPTGKKQNSGPSYIGVAVSTSLATSTCQLRHDQMEQGPTEPHTGHSTFLLSSGGVGGGYY